MWQTLVRYIKFASSTLAGTVVDTAVLFVLTHYVFHNYVGKFLVSPAISFECAMFTNFVLAYFFVWKDRIGQRTRRSFGARLLGYNVTCITGFLIKMFFLLLVHKFTDQTPVVCNLIALCFSGIFNFFVNEYVVFSKRFSKKD